MIEFGTALSPRRYYLAKMRSHLKDGLDIWREWQGKHLEQPGTDLASDFPSKTALESAGYVAIEDFDGATSAELVAAGLTTRQAAAVLTAIAALE
jgi:hypothetical protein